jgi:hypothetical protein
MIRRKLTTLSLKNIPEIDFSHYFTRFIYEKCVTLPETNRYEY